MATSGCASAGLSTVSRMNQLEAFHRLARWRPSSVPLPHPCKLVFLVDLRSTRLSPATPSRHRLPLPSSPFCCHGELEIVSIKELADGFLHFSFGTPSKKDDLSSCCGEHLARNLSVPKRLPSKFSKRSPIPLAAVRRKRQEKSSSKVGSADPTGLSAKETINPSSRPKSYFFKLSPIPKGKSESLSIRENLSNGTVVHKNNLMHQEPKAVPKKDTAHARPISMFVRNSPVPSLNAKVRKRHEIPSASSNSSPTEVSKDASDIQVSSRTGSSLRPKSSFSRRSPIEKDQHFSQGASIMSKPSSPKPLSNRETASMEANAKSQDMAEPSTHSMVDLEKCKLSDLKNLAKLKGVKGFSKLKKAELLEVLMNLGE